MGTALDLNALGIACQLAAYPEWVRQNEEVARAQNVAHVQLYIPGCPNILIIDHDENNRRILVYRLRKTGAFNFREAATGRQAIELVRAELPDLIFSCLMHAGPDAECVV